MSCPGASTGARRPMTVVPLKHDKGPGRAAGCWPASRNPAGATRGAGAPTGAGATTASGKAASGKAASQRAARRRGAAASYSATSSGGGGGRIPWRLRRHPLRRRSLLLAHPGCLRRTVLAQLPAVLTAARDRSLGAKEAEDHGGLRSGQCASSSSRSHVSSADVWPRHRAR